jgi:hypothetical protein
MAMNRLSVALAARRPRVVLPTPGGPQRMNECNLPASNARTQRLAGAEQVPLPDEFIQRLGPQEFGQGRLGLCRE